MPKFEYNGKTNAGRPTSGVITAKDIAAAQVALKKKQIVATSLTEKAGGLGSIELTIPGFGPKVETKEIVIFTRQFATMIDAGLPLVQCLDILGSQQENALFKKILGEIKASVEGGSTFAEALKKHPDTFDDLFVNLVAAGEVGGILDTILNRLSGFMEKSAKLKGKIKGALTYPVAVIVIAAVVVSGLLIFVVPIFEDMFAGFGSALPMPTQVVVIMSDTIKAYWYMILGVIFGTIFGLKRWHKTKTGKRILDGIFLKMPVAGDLLSKTAVARFTRTLGTMMSSGVPILEALEIVAKTAGNVVIEAAIMKARGKLGEGSTLAEPLAETGVFPGMVTQMISVGESTGAMDTMLNKIADFYEDEVDASVDSMTALIEPMLMAFLGVVVGGLVIALYLPIFSLAGAVGA
ncbi:MAG: type II secretion system F family protein [Deltaproteobacteria bacterium]|nr:type II secretion system F family protein [Deltaproteobacteria bacterium]